MSRFRRLPWSTTLALCLVLICTCDNLVRLWTGIAWRTLLQEYAPHPGALYVAFTGALFSVVGLLILWAFWRRLWWTPRALLLGTWLYAAWFWADRLLLQSQEQANWPFVLVVTLILLSFLTTVSVDPRNPGYFGKEEYGREFEDRKTA
jgi:hypothetical protein